MDKTLEQLRAELAEAKAAMFEAWARTGAEARTGAWARTEARALAEALANSRALAEAWAEAWAEARAKVKRIEAEIAELKQYHENN